MRVAKKILAAIAIGSAACALTTGVVAAESHQAAATASNLFDPLTVQGIPSFASSGSRFVALNAAQQPPKITASQIQAIAAPYVRNISQSASPAQVRYEYVAWTSPTTLFTPKILQDDPALAHSKHPYALPVWIVSVQGVPLPMNGAPGSPGGQAIGSVNYLFDATSGDWLGTFSWGKRA